MDNHTHQHHFQPQPYAPPTILCCLCGVAIEANPSRMCANCLRSQVDITEGIPKQLSVEWCKGCNRYLQTQNQWLTVEPESRELMSLLLKKIKGLKKVRLTDASFVWTEPHSRRLKVKLTIQKEVFSATILQQVFVVEFVVEGLFCSDCHRVEAKNTWQAMVQLRQRVGHKRTILFLEQLVLKHNAHSNCTIIKSMPDGMDFYFHHPNHARKFQEFITSVVPSRVTSSKKLISHDEHSNIFNYKHTTLVECVPVCRHDLVCLPTKLASSLGNIGPIVLCSRISNLIHFIDPNTLKRGELSATSFWAIPFRSLANSKNTVEYVVLDISLCGPSHGKFVLADVEVARSADLGYNDVSFLCRTHLGRFLNVGDTVSGYDLASANFNDSDVESMKRRTFPDVVLVQKKFERQQHKRIYMLKRLDANTREDEEIPARLKDENQAEQDFEEMLESFDEDPELRSQVNLYKVPDAEKILLHRQEDSTAMVDENDPAFADVRLDELLEPMDNLSIQ